MGPITGKEDYFESTYLEKFRSEIGPLGIFLKYEQDRAGIDIGFHLYEPKIGKELSASTTRIWFQLKGIHESTISKSKLETDTFVVIKMNVDYLKYYYFMSEPVFMAVYLEALDIFVVSDLKDVVDNQLGGVRFFSAKNVRETTSFKISINARMDDKFWQNCHSYKSLLVRPPLFRGKSLGHKLDPLRCSLEKLDPNVFLSMMNELLTAHEYEIDAELSIDSLFQLPIGNRRLTVGCLFQSWEWSWQLSHQYVEDEKTGFRKDGMIYQKQGNCGVLIDGEASESPSRQSIQEIIVQLSEYDADELLVFANTNDAAYFGTFFSEVQGSGIKCFPQLLGDIPYNLLQNQIIFKKYIDKIEWHSLVYL